MAACRVRKIVDEIQVRFTLQAAEAATAEMGSRKRLLRVEAQVRRVLEEHVTTLAGEIRGDAHLVHAVIHPSFIECPITERAGQGPDRAPDRAAVETTTLECPERRIVAADAELAAAVVQGFIGPVVPDGKPVAVVDVPIALQQERTKRVAGGNNRLHLSLIHISEPTRLGMISYAVFCLKKKK